MIYIKVTLVAHQNSKDASVKTVDKAAQVLDFEQTVRIFYQDDAGGINTLDVGTNYIHMQRDHEWITQMIFTKGKGSSAKVISQEGELRFNINVVKLEIDSQRLYVKYQLLQDNALIDTHTYFVEWRKEEEAWQEIH